MNDEAQSSQEPVVAKTLNDVMSEFNVQAPTQAAPEPIKPVQPTQSRIDPYDESSLNQFAQNTAKDHQELLNRQNTQQAELDAYKAERAEAKFQTDIQSAASKLSDNMTGVDKLTAEILLEREARKDPNFKTIWDTQDTNPKALEAALSIIASREEGKFAMKADPQLAENHRAAQQSTQSNATQTAKEYGNSLEEQLANAKNPNEEAFIWNQIKSGG